MARGTVGTCSIHLPVPKGSRGFGQGIAGVTRTNRPWGRVRAICANVAPLDRATSSCAKAKHCPQGLFSEEVGRTPVRRTPGCSKMGQDPQTPCAAKCLGNL